MQGRTRFGFLRDPANRGKHLICVAGRVFRAQTGKGALKILARIQRQYPRRKVTLTYIPKSDTLIL